MPDDHSKLVPLLPIPNRTVKRLCADDSADPRVKVGHRQAFIKNSFDEEFRGVLEENAGIAQLVERNLAKVEVESSRLFSRSNSEDV